MTRYAPLSKKDRVAISTYLESLIDAGNEDTPEEDAEILRLAERVMKVTK